MMADAAQTLPKRLGAKSSFPILALTLASLFWSGNFIVGRALRGLIDPLSLNFARWALALVLMGPFVWRDFVASMPVLRREWRLVLALGATGIAAFHTLVYFALQRTTATNALLILALAPAATVTGAAALSSEPLRPIQFFGTLLSLAGVWPSVESKMAMTVNVRAALAYAARSCSSNPGAISQPAGSRGG
jgi:drug/metabolite transporter (DMT)-like permease